MANNSASDINTTTCSARLGLSLFTIYQYMFEVNVIRNGS